MSITITAPADGAFIPNDQISINLNGTTTQSVNGIPLAAQSFSLPTNVSNLSSGEHTFTVTNSAGEVDSIMVTVESKEGASVHAGSTDSITDTLGQVWTISGGKAFKDGVDAGGATGVTELFYHNHLVYETDGTSWLYYDPTPWRAGTDPRPVATVGFWGVNGHIGWSAPYTNSAATIAAIKDLGMKGYRNGCSSGVAPQIKAFIQNYAADAGVAVYPVLLPDVASAVDEASAYTIGFNLGVEVATNLKGLVPIYEVGNELDSWCILGGSYNGDIASHYDNAKYKICRGAVRGMIAGIRSKDTTTKLAGPAGLWLHYGFHNMLQNGTAPDGSTGAPTVTWDVTAWHWYSDMGDIENASFIHANVLSKIAAYGKPIWITEYGVRSGYSTDEVARTAYLTGATCMADWKRLAATYNIQHTAMYELFDDGRSGDEGQFGLVLNDGVTPKPTRYAAVKNFIASN